MAQRRLWNALTAVEKQSNAAKPTTPISRCSSRNLFNDPPQTGRRHLCARQSCQDSPFQNRFRSLFTYPFPAATQRRRTDRQCMPEVLFATKILEIRVFYPPPHRLFIRCTEGMAEIGQAYQQTNRDTRPTFVRVQLTKLALEHLSRNQPAQTYSSCRWLI